MPDRSTISAMPASAYPRSANTSRPASSRACRVTSARAHWRSVPMTPLIPVVRLPERPGPAGVVVAGLDVAEAPGDLGGRAGLPVRTGRGHLAAREGLRDAVGAAAGVGGRLAPVALVVPHGEQRRPAGAPALEGVHLLAEGLVGGRVGGLAA